MCDYIIIMMHVDIDMDTPNYVATLECSVNK